MYNKDEIDLMINYIKTNLSKFNGSIDDNINVDIKDGWYVRNEFNKYEQYNYFYDYHFYMALVELYNRVHNDDRIDFKLLYISYFATDNSSKRYQFEFKVNSAIEFRSFITEMHKLQILLNKGSNLL